MIFFSAKNRRFSSDIPVWTWVCLSAAISTGIFGCALRVEEEAVPEARVAGNQPETPTAAKPLEAPKTTQEITPTGQGLTVQELKVLEERGQTFVSVEFSRPITNYRHFTLIRPSRIVVDVFGDAKRLAPIENFRVDTHWVSNLRLSSSEGYLRLVIEDASGAVPSYLIEPKKRELRISVGSANPAATARKELRLIQAGKRSDIQVAEQAKPVVQEAGTPTPTPPASVKGEKQYTGQRISLDFKDADIKNVFRLLAEVSGLNLIVTDEVRLRVTIRLVDVPWDQVMDLLIDTNGLAKEQIGNVVRISTAGKLRADKEALAAARRAGEIAEIPQVAYLSLNYAQAKDLAVKIKPVLSTGATIVFDDRTNTIVVRGSRKGLEEVTEIVSRLDTRTPQVLIESNLIETTPSFARALGMEFSFDAPIHDNPVATVTGGAVTGRSVGVNIPFKAEAPSGGTPFFSVLQNRLGSLRNIQARLTAAEKEGNVRIISRPSVVTLNNVESTIQSLRILRILLPSSGTTIGAAGTVATERINVGITLTVTPQVSSDGFVLMNINVKSSSIATNILGGSVVPFDELSREAKANILVRDGETIVIGGIMKDTKTTSESGIPYLRSIPILGWLFKNISWQKDFEELMVFITPRIVAGGSETLPNAEQLWRETLKKTEGR